MKTAKRLLVVTAVGLLLAGAAPLVAAQVVYAYSLHELGTPPPVPAQALAAPTARVFWSAAGERLPPKVERLAAWRYGWALAYDRESLTQRRPGERMAWLAARGWVSRRPSADRMKWAVTGWAATVWVSRHWDAGQMTQVWVESAWFGRGAQGVDAASSTYFGRAARDLTLGQIALLAALTPSPSRFDPGCFPDRATTARNRILTDMLSSGAITAADYDAAVAEPLVVAELRCDREARGTRGP